MLLKIIRASEWWGYKISPLLAIAYATLLIYEKNIYSFAGIILLVLLSLVIGAVYVSVINDITDVKEDMAIGKKNRMVKAPLALKVALPLILLSIGLCFIFLFYRFDALSVFFYSMPWILFSLYSFEPFRFKRRGILGVMCDAGGAHIFTSLLMISFITFKSGGELNLFWMASVALWATAYGLKGILWHQFTDRENDINTHVKTFASQTTPAAFKKIEKLIFVVELVALAGMLWIIPSIWPVIGFIFYILLSILRYKYLHRQPVIILMEGKQNVQILTLDYFHAIFPISLLIAACFTQQNAWIVLVAHLLLFPKEIYIILKDIKTIAQKIFY